MGLDEKADFDYFTIYEKGGAAPPKLQEAGLDTKADFDYYTIYDQCSQPPKRPGVVGKYLILLSDMVSPQSQQHTHCSTESIASLLNAEKYKHGFAI